MDTLKAIFKQTLLVTPEVAAKLLKNNICNRPINKAIVNKYAGFMIREAWVSLPQSRIITINTCGNLLDGQHRLLAIEQSGVPQEMDIWQTNTSETAMFLPFDRGRTRTASDVTGMPSSIHGTINMIYYIAKNISACPDDRAIRFFANLDEEEKEFLEYIAQQKFANTKQPLKAGAFYWFCINRNKEYIYRIMDEITSICPVDRTAQLIRGYVFNDHSTGRTARREQFKKTYTLLDQKKRVSEKVENLIFEEVKNWANNRF